MSERRLRSTFSWQGQRGRQWQHEVAASYLSRLPYKRTQLIERFGLDRRNWAGMCPALLGRHGFQVFSNPGEPASQTISN
jgi:hypothetical protein